LSLARLSRRSAPATVASREICPFTRSCPAPCLGPSHSALISPIVGFWHHLYAAFPLFPTLAERFDARPSRFDSRLPTTDYRLPTTDYFGAAAVCCRAAATT